MPPILLHDRTALITGASSGIGAATARAFATDGARLILAARRANRLEALAAELRDRHGGETLVLPLDVRSSDAVAAALAGLPTAWRDIDILVNNAGLSRCLSPLHDGAIEDWEEMIDANVKGLLYVTRAVLPGMVAREQGHVINLGSIAGREVYPGGNVYCATKSAVAALTRSLRVDLLGSGVRVTLIEPGMVETEFSVVRFRGDAARAAQVYEGMQPLAAEDVADAILWAATRPPHVDVQDILLMPTAQADSTRVARTVSPR